MPSVYIQRDPINERGASVPAHFKEGEIFPAIAPHEGHTGDMRIITTFNMKWQAILTCVEKDCGATCMATAALSDFL